MTRRYVQNALGSGNSFDFGGTTLNDYGPVVVLYGSDTVQGICAFEPGIPTDSGIEVGMTLEDARAKVPEWAEETEGGGGTLLKVGYSASGSAPGGEPAYTTGYVISDNKVDHIITAYPGYFDALLEAYAITAPSPAKTFQTPNGEVRLDMRRSAVETMYTQQYEIETEDGGLMLDYGALLVIYDAMSNAKSIRAFEPGIVTADGIQVGMTFEEVLAKLPQRAREITVQDDQAIRIGYSATGEAPDGPAAYTGIYRFTDGLLNRIVIGYPGYTT
jgi:hypothetical protein